MDKDIDTTINPTAGPVPSKLVLLNEIPRQKLGSKVRFLGCPRPRSIHNPAPSSIKVDITLILESIKKPEILDVRSWVNVIGYVVKSSKEPPQGSGAGSAVGSAPGAAETKGRKEAFEKSVQAVLMWSAGSIDVGEYERVVLGSRDVDK